MGAALNSGSFIDFGVAILDAVLSLFLSVEVLDDVFLLVAGITNFPLLDFRVFCDGFVEVLKMLLCLGKAEPSEGNLL